MARSRNIKPGFFKNELLAQLCALSRIAFAGLWCAADRAGRLEDRPLRLKIEILPYDDCDMDAILCDLEEARFILRYEVDNIKYIQILNFEKHQSPHKNEAESTIPAPCNSGAATEGAPVEHECTRPDSLIPDSLNLDSAQITDLFDTFWLAYPKKKDKSKALKAFSKKTVSQHAEEIIADVQNRKTKDWDWVKDEGKYIPYPTTYLNGRRWEDELTPIPAGQVVQIGRPRRRLSND